MDNGWIKLHRSIMNSDVWGNDRYFKLWCYLLMRANHEKRGFWWNDSFIEVEKGTFVTGRKQISKDTKMPESTIEDALRFLETRHQIRQQKTSKYRLITILKWDSYQNPTSNPTSGRHLADTNNNYKNYKNTSDMGFNNKSEDYEDLPAVDLDSGEMGIPTPLPSKNKIYDAAIAWADNYSGSKLKNQKAKEYGALKKIVAAGYTTDEVKVMYKDLYQEPFYKKKGISYWDVLSRLNTKGK